jgi:hypothetical protein
MAHPATKLATAIQLGIKPDPALIFGDKAEELQTIKDPIERQSWLIEQLGPEYAKQWSDLHKTQ